MKQYRHAVSALVIKRSEVCTQGGCLSIPLILLVHKPRKGDNWQLPQGGVEEGETVEQAAIRELQEETGLRIDTVPVLSECTYSYDFPEGFVRRHKPVNAGQTLCFVIIEAPKEAKVQVDNDEIDAYQWVPPEDLPKYIQRKEYLEVILRVLREYEASPRLKNGKEGISLST